MLILDGTANLGSEKAESRLMSIEMAAAELISEGWSAYTLPQHADNSKFEEKEQRWELL